MARSEFIELDVPTEANGNGAPYDVSKYRDKIVQISGTFTATVEVQGTVNGTDWFGVTDGTFTAPGFVEILSTLQSIRLVVSGHSSGQPVGHFGGFNERTR